MKKVTSAIMLMALSPIATAEILEIGVGSNVLVFNTPEMPEGGFYRGDINERVSVVNYNDARTDGERSFDIDRFNSVVSGRYEVVRDRFTLQYEVTMTVRWQNPDKTWCRVSGVELTGRRLPLSYKAGSPNNCSTAVYLRRSPNQIGGTNESVGENGGAGAIQQN